MRISVNLLDTTETLCDYTNGFNPKRRIPDGFGLSVKVNGKWSKPYREVGWVWRDRTDVQSYVLTSGDRERFLPDDTPVKIVPLAER